MKKIYPELLFYITLILFSCQQKHANNQPGKMLNKQVRSEAFKRNVIELDNGIVVLKVNLNGGSYIDFHFKDLPVNPINWIINDSTQPPFMGHFLCFDRWGPPSEGEKANGFRHHGEVNLETWKLLSPPEKKNGFITCSMMCRLPMGGLQLTRIIKLFDNAPVFYVTEEIKNLNKYGRMFNIVQHVTIAPPFLDTNTLFDNNTEKGFEDKEDGSLNQENPVLMWPVVNHNCQTVNLRQFRNEWPRVSSFTFNKNDKYGWVTACNPSQKLILGYIWETEDYSWINFWRSMENGIPVAFGMEFGTTGLHEPFPVVAKKGKIFGRNIYAFIDANEIIRKSFTAFIAKIPSDYNGVEKIEVVVSSFIVKEKNCISRDITYQLK